jgi:hypothetical protein
VNSVGADGLVATGGAFEQLVTQGIATGTTMVVAFVGSLVLVKAIDLALGFVTDPVREQEGLDRTEHGEIGFDFGPQLEMAALAPSAEPRAASAPPNGQRRYSIVIDGAKNGDVIHAWSELCQPATGAASSPFQAVYPNVTTMQGNRFRFRGGDPQAMKVEMEKLFRDRLRNANIRAQVEA